MKHLLWKRILYLALRFCVGCVLVFSGWIKIENGLSFLASVYDYQLFSRHFGVGIAIILPWIEFITGLCLISGTMLFTGFFSATILAAAFVATQSFGIHNHLQIDCGCFGSSPGHEHYLGFNTLLRACLLFVGSTAGAILSLSNGVSVRLQHPLLSCPSIST